MSADSFEIFDKRRLIDWWRLIDGDKSSFIFTITIEKGINRMACQICLNIVRFCFEVFRFGFQRFEVDPRKAHCRAKWNSNAQDNDRHRPRLWPWRVASGEWRVQSWHEHWSSNHELVDGPIRLPRLVASKPSANMPLSPLHVTLIYAKNFIFWLEAQFHGY